MRCLVVTNKLKSKSKINNVMQYLAPLKNEEDLLDLAMQRVRENKTQLSTGSSVSKNGMPLFKDITPRKRKQIVNEEQDAN